MLPNSRKSDKPLAIPGADVQSGSSNLSGPLRTILLVQRLLARKHKKNVLIATTRKSHFGREG